MFYKKKIKGVSIIEVLVSISIISIFTVVLFPILKVNNKINNMIYFQSIIDKNKGDIVKIIENSIEISQNYWSIETFKESVSILSYNKELPRYIDESFFANKKDEGNLIFIKIPILKKSKILKSFLVFYLYRNSLYIYQGVYLGKIWYIEDQNEFIKNISGSFKRIKKGIFIVLKFKTGGMYEEAKGYENFKR